MIIEYEQYYCKSCCKLFNDIVHKPYYTYNDFIDNQARLTLDVDYRRKLTQPNYHNRCPFCFSVHNVNVAILKAECEKYINRTRGGSLKYASNTMKEKIKLYKKLNSDTNP